MYRSSFYLLTIVGLFASIILFSPMLMSAEEKHKYSGFLDDYPRFEVNEETGAEIWFKSNKKGVLVLKPYNKVLLSPIEVWINNDASYKGINPDELKVITDYFATAIKNKLGSMYPVVAAPGPGVLHLRIAITNVNRSKPKRQWSGKGVNLYEATVEMEVLDSMTEERLVAAIDTHKTDKIKEKEDDVSWKPIREILDYWADRMRAHLDESRRWSM